MTPNIAQFDLLDSVDLRRQEADQELSSSNRAEMGQFFTPAPVARFMASLFSNLSGTIELLDPGAGIGSLATAVVERISKLEEHPSSVNLHTYELDPKLAAHLRATIDECTRICNAHDIPSIGRIDEEDFILAGVGLLRDQNTLFARQSPRFTHCIMNPPYRKIHSKSRWRLALKEIGVETSNLYTGFLAVAIQLLSPGGELVAIVPRSFCNGVYFKPFREMFLSEMTLRHLHVFEARDQVFKENDVLQENLILHAIKSGVPGWVEVTSSSDPELQDLTCRQATYAQVVKPGDPHRFINIVVSDSDQLVVDRLGMFTSTLDSLNITVSTGPVVDFRLDRDLRQEPEPGTHPLIYPGHIRHNFIDWPKLAGRKPNAIADTEQSRPWLMPNGWYVITRRFSAKEEKRRIVAAIHSPQRVQADRIGFENHLNVFHCAGAGLERALANGLAIYLNSTLVDLYFRQFSGHTQVNATDLRALPYPSRDTLIRLGQEINGDFPDQFTIDAILEREIRTMTTLYRTADPAEMHRRIQEALAILVELGLPRAQRNDRSALTLLALLGITPSDPWSNAKDPLMGITPIMDFARDHYGRTYAPNTRETFRRYTMHQFVQAGVAIANPDLPERPINSPKWVYQISPHVLDLVRAYGGDQWRTSMATYLNEHKSLIQRYAQERDLAMIPLIIKGESLALTPGSHSLLIKAIIEEFGPRFAPGAEVLYIGDTGSKMVHFDEQSFQALGLVFDVHGKFPDVVLYYREMNWLLLIEAVTSHGPVDAKRHAELESLFSHAYAGLVYVTAFPNRQVMARYLSDISWETEVWAADSPTHLIHFNGENFFGPHN